MSTQMAEALNERIAHGVLAARRDAAVSVEQLSALTGISLRTLWRRLSGKSDWTASELDAVAKALDVTVDSLLHGWPTN